jgi:hypothetical protein
MGELARVSRLAQALILEKAAGYRHSASVGCGGSRAMPQWLL